MPTSLITRFLRHYRAATMLALCTLILSACVIEEPGPYAEASPPVAVSPYGYTYYEYPPYYTPAPALAFEIGGGGGWRGSPGYWGGGRHWR